METDGWRQEYIEPRLQENGTEDTPMQLVGSMYTQRNDILIVMKLFINV